MNDIVLLLGFSVLAFWQKSLFLHLVAAPITIIYGLNYAAAQTVQSGEWAIGVAYIALGFYLLYKPVLSAFGMVKGWLK